MGLLYNIRNVLLVVWEFTVVAHNGLGNTNYLLQNHILLFIEFITNIVTCVQNKLIFQYVFFENIQINIS